MIAAENVKIYLENRDKAESWASWEKSNPGAAALVNYAMLSAVELGMIDENGDLIKG